VATIRGVYLAVVILCVLVGLLTFMHLVGITKRNIRGGKMHTHRFEQLTNTTTELHGSSQDPNPTKKVNSAPSP